MSNNELIIKENILTIVQAANVVGVTHQAIRDAQKRKALATTFILGMRFVHKRDLIEWCTKNKREYNRDQLSVSTTGEKVDPDELCLMSDVRSGKAFSDKTIISGAKSAIVAEVNKDDGVLSAWKLSGYTIFLKKSEVISFANNYNSPKKERASKKSRLVIGAWESGEKNLARISRDTGVSRMSVTRYLEDAGFRARSKKVTKKEMEVRDKRLIEMVLAGKSLEEVEDELGVKPRNASRVIKKHGHLFPDGIPFTLKSSVHNSVVEKWDNGMRNINEIAQKLEIDRSVVVRTLAREGCSSAQG